MRRETTIIRRWGVSILLEPTISDIQIWLVCLNFQTHCCYIQMTMLLILGNYLPWKVATTWSCWMGHGLRLKECIFIILCCMCQRRYVDFLDFSPHIEETSTLEDRLTLHLTISQRNLCIGLSCMYLKGCLFTFYIREIPNLEDE